MYDTGISGKWIRLVEATMKDADAQLKVQTQLVEPFKIRQGLKKVMGWPHLYLPCFSNMSSGSYLSMLTEPKNIILHKL